MRRHATILVCSALVIAAFSLPSMAAERVGSADAGAEQDLFGWINQERTSRGRSAMAWNAKAASVAREHSFDMAAEGRLHHNPNLAGEMPDYQALGENVGVGMSVSSIHGAFMNSSGHRANILGSFSHVGVGVVYDDGTYWVTEVFYTPQASSGSSGSSGGSSSGGSSEGSSDGEDERVTRRTATTARATRAVARATSSVARTAKARVRAANAARVHRVDPPVPPIAQGTMLALERIADEGVPVYAPAPCLPRRVC